MSGALLQAAGLRCARGGRTLFDALSFALSPGEALRVAGPNGSGKTSLLRILCGLLSPTEGTVLWNGADVSRLREDYSAHLVYLGHAAALKDELTAAENLSIACAIAGDARPRAEIEAALERFGLRANALPSKQLSQGQRRRAALARLALSPSRPLWLLDEPFSALDAEAAMTVQTLIGEQLGRAGAVIFTTHQDSGVAASRVIELG